MLSCWPLLIKLVLPELLRVEIAACVLRKMFTAVQNVMTVRRAASAAKHSATLRCCVLHDRLVCNQGAQSVAVYANLTAILQIKLPGRPMSGAAGMTIAALFRRTWSM